MSGPSSHGRVTVKESSAQKPSSEVFSLFQKGLPPHRRKQKVIATRAAALPMRVAASKRARANGAVGASTASVKSEATPCIGPHSDLSGCVSRFSIDLLRGPLENAPFLLDATSEDAASPLSLRVAAPRRLTAADVSLDVCHPWYPYRLVRIVGRVPMEYESLESSERKVRSYVTLRIPAAGHIHCATCNHKQAGAGAVWRAAHAGDADALEAALATGGSTEESSTVSRHCNRTPSHCCRTLHLAFHRSTQLLVLLPSEATLRPSASSWLRVQM
jgi:hypothetical protein